MAPTHSPLRLYEEILLLAPRKRDGRLTGGESLPFALSGAIMAELLIGGHLSADIASRSALITSGAQPPTGDELLDDCVKDVVARTRRSPLEAWVGRWARRHELRHKAAMSLCRRGVLRVEQKRVLRIFRHTVFFGAESGPEVQIRRRILEAIESELDHFEPRIIALISLAFNAGFLGGVLDLKQLKQKQARVKHIIEGELTGPAVKAQIDAADTAAAVMIVTSSY